MIVNSYEIVTVFEMDESVVLSLGPYLKNLKKGLGGKLLPIMTPEDAPPPIPRLVMTFSDSILKLGFDRLGININPPPHVHSDIKKSSKFAFQRAESILKELLPRIAGYHWCGTVASLSFPLRSSSCSSAIDAVRPVFQKLVNLDHFSSNLASFQMQFGIRDGLFNKNYNIAGFEKRNIQLHGKTQQLIHGKTQQLIKIPLDSIPVTDCGLQIVLDINNRPGGASQNALHDISNILSMINDQCETLAIDLNLEEIL